MQTCTLIIYKYSINRSHLFSAQNKYKHILIFLCIFIFIMSKCVFQRNVLILLFRNKSEIVDMVHSSGCKSNNLFIYLWVIHVNWFICICTLHLQQCREPCFMFYISSFSLITLLLSSYYIVRTVQVKIIIIWTPWIPVTPTATCMYGQSYIYLRHACLRVLYIYYFINLKGVKTKNPTKLIIREIFCNLGYFSMPIAGILTNIYHMNYHN